METINWNNVTLATAAIVAVGFVWRAYTEAIKEHIKDLRAFNDQKYFDLTARVMVLEDKNGIKRSDRFQYMPPDRAEERRVLENLDG